MNRKRGIAVDITAADTDTDVFECPKNRTANILLIEVRNSTASDARIRLWDTYTINATSYRKKKADYEITAGDTVSIRVEESKHVIGKLVAQSTVAGVELYIGAVLK